MDKRNKVEMGEERNNRCMNRKKEGRKKEEVHEKKERKKERKKQYMYERKERKKERKKEGRGA